MTSSLRLGLVVVVVVVAAAAVATAALLLGHTEAKQEKLPPDASPAFMLRLRGFIADEFSLVTKSGYVLRLTRGRNPLFEQRPLADKEPILFLHGVLSNANIFLLNSFDVRPKDLSNLNLNSMTLDQAKTALANEPSAKSLPFLALNRGHVVWILNRRGNPGSQQRQGDPLTIKSKPTNETKAGLLGNSKLGNLVGNFARLLLNQPRTIKGEAFALDAKYWDYSLDQQALEDFPMTIDFALNNTQGARRIAVVGHSAGGALTLIGLSQMAPEARRRISAAVLWAPSYATSNKNAFFNIILRPLVKLTALSPGPLILPPFLVNPHLSFMMAACSSPLFWRTICEHIYDWKFGPSGGKQPMRPEFIIANYESTSGHELAQQGQQLDNPPNHTMRKFDYGPKRNMLEYGQPKPPAYDLSNLAENSTKFSFYTSPHDILVTPADVQTTRSQLRVPSLYTVINDTFNHNGFFFHDNTQNLAIIPSMYDIETAGQPIASGPLSMPAAAATAATATATVTATATART